MSDTVWLALIAGFPPTLIALGTLIVAIGGLVVALHNGKKITDTKKEVAMIKDVAKREHEEIDQLTTGAYLRGQRQGEANVRQQVSDYGSLPPLDWKG